MLLSTFQQAIEEANLYKKRHLLLGNGFSIACRPQIFTYGQLYEQADFSKISATAKLAFSALGTRDFERVIKVLRDAAQVNRAYGSSSSFVNLLQEDANGLRELLVQTIANSHPSWPADIKEEEYFACNQFLNYFDTIYTLNYDLLLYWTKMHTGEGERSNADDGFRTSADDPTAGYVVWEPGQSRSQNVWFLHGALHIFDSGTEVQKYTWSKTGVRLIDQIRDALNRDFFPIFVSEGTSKEKYERIRHCDYLAKAYRSFESIQGALFIYGHSLAENDEHYLRCIRKGKIEHLYVGLYGDTDSDLNKFICRRANQLATGRKGKTVLNLTFYDAASANVWSS